MSAPASCVFCDVLDGTVPAHVVFEDESTIAILDRAPAVSGHTLVIPRRHVTDLLDADVDQLAAIARATQAIARLQIARLGAGGITVFQANRPLGWQEVLHLHVHVVPRFAGDALVPPWRSEPVGDDELGAVAARLTD